MPTKTRRPATSKRANPARPAQRAIGRGLAAWAGFTLARDTSPTIYRVPHVAINWAVLCALGLGWWQAWNTHWQLLGVLTALGLVYTAARAARHVPARARTLRTWYEATARSCRHPRSTTTNPVDPVSRIVVRRWKGPKTPLSGQVGYSPDSPAASLSNRWSAEKAIEGLGTPSGQDLVFDWETQPGSVVFHTVDSDDPRVVQKKDRRWVESTIAQLFPSRRSAADELDVAIEFDTSTSDRPSPETITVTIGAYDVSARAFRDQVERTFDAQVDRGVEWLYDWSQPGLLVITAADRGSSRAQRKRLARKIDDVITTALGRVKGRTAQGQVEVAVTKWVDDENHPQADTPIEVVVQLGTVDMSSTTDQARVEGTVDQALENEWPDRVWLHTWSFGHTTAVAMAAVPRNHHLALRKAEQHRLKNVVQEKFPTKKGGTPADLEVLKWQDKDTDNADDPREHPAQMRVTFGSLDVTNLEVRQEFERHLDSVTTENDWNYRWNPPEGAVVLTAVPRLPDQVVFPDENTDELHRWEQEFLAGRIILGPVKGGGEAAIDLNVGPHTLVGGQTGKGKSVLLTLVLFGALRHPRAVELVVVDPKVTDFTWTPGYPNVRFYAVNDARQRMEEIHAAVQYAHEAMVRRQNLLHRYQVKNLATLRELAVCGTIDLDPAQVPGRLIVFFDEIGEAFNPVKNNPDMKALQDEARTWLEGIGMLGRAMEVNIVCAAQKPSAENIGTVIRAQCGNRVGIGYLDTWTSNQVLGVNLCTTLDPESTPKGRGWVLTEGNAPGLVQTYNLPERTITHPDDPSQRLEGVQERVAARLDTLGYCPVKVPHTFMSIDPDGNTVEESLHLTQWVRPEVVEEREASPPDPETWDGYSHE